MQPVGTMRTWIQSYWQQHGERLMRDDGSSTVTPKTQREWMLKRGIPRRVGFRS
jgi:hypothetical protein